MSMDRGKCRSCGADILWAVMVSMKKNPLDVAPVEIPADQPEQVLIEIGGDGFGRTVRGRKGYRSHFATCPSAASHRKARPAKGEQMELGR